MIKINSIVCGDVIRVLSSLKAEEKKINFNVIIADPPYNIGKDFGNNKDLLPIEKYISWCRSWINECLDLLENDGIMYIYGFTEVLARISSIYPIDKQRFLIWHYTNKTAPGSVFWQRSHEAILCLWKNKRPQLAIDQIREPYCENYAKLSGKTRKATVGRYSRQGKPSVYDVHPKGALPRDVIKVPALSGGAGMTERHFICKTCGNNFYHSSNRKYHIGHQIFSHPTQKPLVLAEKLIFSSIKKQNGKILIPFAGSGSECIVASRNGINFLGIELNPAYVDYAKKWLKNDGKKTFGTKDLKARKQQYTTSANV